MKKINQKYNNRPVEFSCLISFETKRLCKLFNFVFPLKLHRIYGNVLVAKGICIKESFTAGYYLIQRSRCIVHIRHHAADIDEFAARRAVAG